MGGDVTNTIVCPPQPYLAWVPEVVVPLGSLQGI
jgi:hypothetical protein